MNMEKRQKVGVGLTIILVLILIVLLVYFRISNSKIKEHVGMYFKDKETVEIMEDVISNQLKKDDEIQNLLKDTSYTFESPCVMVDPYGISPLTALIIFTTNEEVEIAVTVNGSFVTTMESAKIHSIPIYGLKAGINNQVVLKYHDQTKEINIDRTNIEGKNLNVEVSNDMASIDKEVYFLSSPMSIGASSYDGNGNLVWYLTEPYSMDIEFLENGHMYLSNGVSSGTIESYDGFYEIDYLGRIYKSYSLEYGYHHELIHLSDGSILVSGSNSDYLGLFVYQIDGKSGNVLKSLDLYSIFASLDSSFASQLVEQEVFINSISYDEKSKDMIISLRDINTIVSVNFETEKINWIFGDPSIYPESLSNYELKINDGSRYPKGAHTAFLTSDGYLGLFNNDFDALDHSDASMLHYLDNYSSAVLYKIEGKEVKTVWEYDASKKYFTYALGSFYYNNQTKLINFGWTYTQSAFVSGNTLFDVAGTTYARIMELDQNDNVVFHATYDYGVYRTLKHRLYEEKTKNYLDYDYSYISDKTKPSLTRLKTNRIFEELDRAILSPYDISLTRNTITLNVMFDSSEEVDVYFVSDELDTYLLHYKIKDEIFQSSVPLNLNGNYAIYIKINGQMYNTNKVFSN